MVTCLADGLYSPNLRLLGRSVMTYEMSALAYFRQNSQTSGLCKGREDGRERFTNSRSPKLPTNDFFGVGVVVGVDVLISVTSSQQTSHNSLPFHPKIVLSVVLLQVGQNFLNIL